MFGRHFGMKTRGFTAAMVVAVAVLQASCGGGSSGSATANLDVNPIGGYPILGSTITIKGSSGNSVTATGNASTGVASFNSGQLFLLGGAPYLIKISGGTANGVARTTDLYSIATSTSGRVNVTPITHLLAVQATGSTNSAGIAALFSGTNFNAAKAATLTSAAISTAKANVETALKAANPLIDLAGVDPLTVAITFGDTNDGLLDQLNLTLKNANVTLDTVQNYVATVSTGGTPNTTAVKPFSRVIVFGDSLSDGGAYTAWASAAASGANRFIGGVTLRDKLAAAAPYGGKFTTNPGKVWVENLASTLGYDLKPANLMGGGATSLNLTTLDGCTSCTNYAQGGSRVALQPGIGNVGTTANPLNAAFAPAGFTGNASGAPVPADPVLLGVATADYTVTNPFLGASSLPVVQQIDQHLASTYVTAGQFDSKDLVIVLAGANDVFTQAGLAGAGAITSTVAGTRVGTAAGTLAAQVARLKTAGARNVLVVGLPDMGVNPYAISSGATTAGALTALSQTAFNATLRASLPTTGVAYLDPVPLFTMVVANPSTYGFTKVVDSTSATTAIQSAACGPNVIAQTTAADSATSPGSLFCSVANTTLGIVGTLRALLSNETYVFADGVHPTTKMHKVLSQYVIDKMGLLLAAAI
jgi:phospholipase/lecithinase/hemolysin